MVSADQVEVGSSIHHIGTEREKVLESDFIPCEGTTGYDFIAGSKWSEGTHIVGVY